MGLKYLIIAHVMYNLAKFTQIDNSEIKILPLHLKKIYNENNTTSWEKMARFGIDLC